MKTVNRRTHSHRSKVKNNIYLVGESVLIWCLFRDCCHALLICVFFFFWFSTYESKNYIPVSDENATAIRAKRYERKQSAKESEWMSWEQRIHTHIEEEKESERHIVSCGKLLKYRRFYFISCEIMRKDPHWHTNLRHCTHMYTTYKRISDVICQNVYLYTRHIHARLTVHT